MITIEYFDIYTVYPFFCPLVYIYTNGTNKLWDFNIAADIKKNNQKSKFLINKIEDILKTSKPNGNEVITHIIQFDVWKEGGVILSFHTFSLRFFYRLYLTMQNMRTWPKLSNYRTRSQKWYSINCGHDGHVCKTNIRTFINSFYSHCHGWFSWSIKFTADIFFCIGWMAMKNK